MEVANATLSLSLSYLFPEIRTHDGRIERTLKFLLVLFRRHVLADGDKLVLGKNSGLGCSKHCREPVRTRLRALVDFGEIITPLGRSDEGRPDRNDPLKASAE